MSVISKDGRSLRIVALTPARGGSKSVPYKNLHDLGGKPLLAWPLETAASTQEIDEVWVSTDDAHIAEMARKYGARIHDRPEHLATDTALVVDTIRHFCDERAADGHPVDVLVLLEATSPFRRVGLVSACIAKLLEEDLDSIATFSEAPVNPERCWRIENGLPVPFIDGAIPWKPRQQLTPALALNGAVYAFRPDKMPADTISILFGQIGALEISASEVVDIDDRKDFVIANAILESRNSPITL